MPRPQEELKRRIEELEEMLWSVTNSLAAAMSLLGSLKGGGSGMPPIPAQVPDEINQTVELTLIEGGKSGSKLGGKG